MATAGGLVFFAQREGQFIAADARTGKLLWDFYTGGRIRAAPMSCTVMGKKYVAIASWVPIDAERGGKGERFTAQTPEEAERLAGYNRYLAALAAGDAEADGGSGAAR